MEVAGGYLGRDERDGRWTDDRGELKVEMSRKEERGTGRQNRKSGAGDVIKSPSPPSEPTAIHPRMVATHFVSHLDGGSKSGCEFPSF